MSTGDRGTDTPTILVEAEPEKDPTRAVPTAGPSAQEVLDELRALAEKVDVEYDVDPSLDNAFVRFDGPNGKLQSSQTVEDDLGNVAVAAALETDGDVQIGSDEISRSLYFGPTFQCLASDAPGNFYVGSPTNPESTYYRVGGTKSHVFIVSGTQLTVSNGQVTVANDLTTATVTSNDLNTRFKGDLATVDATPQDLETIPIPDGESRLISLTARGAEATSGECFAMQIIKHYKNAGGTVSEITRDDGGSASEYFSREDTNLTIQFATGGPGEVTAQFVGDAANACSGKYYIEVM